MQQAQRARAEQASDWIAQLDTKKKNTEIELDYIIQIAPLQRVIFSTLIFMNDLMIGHPVHAVFREHFIYK